MGMRQETEDVRVNSEVSSPMLFNAKKRNDGVVQIKKNHKVVPRY